MSNTMSSFLPTNDPGANITVTKEEFNLFHNIDRQLFTRLVVGLGRDTSQSTHVIAFIMWLEKLTRDFRMVSNLLQWPDILLNDLADETVLALNCIESPQFPHASSNDYKGLLPLIQKITRSTITLQYFYEKRIDIIPAVTKLLNDVCTRAFTDIVQQVHYQKAMKEQNFHAANFYGAMPPPHPYVPQVVYYAPVPAGVTIVPQQMVVPHPPQWNEGSSSSWGGAAAAPSGGGGFNPFVVNKNEVNQEFNEMLANLKLSSATGNADGGRKEKEVPADDRTIFMTFSKGYPISETEVREFFKRRYGDIIEMVFMQEVHPNEQPLYARLVVRPGAMHMIDGLLEGTSRVKFAINGKHVWARRYVRKGNKSPQTSSPVTSRPPSPSAAGTSY